MTKLLTLVVLGLAVQGQVGCGPPPLTISQISQMEDPALAAIRATFASVVDDAKSHPELKWHSGWLGNIWVNSGGDDHLGLCYHWQDWVYDGVLATVETVGWEATGLVINERTKHEHHAVLVYDPTVSVPDELIASPAAAPSYVLDAWRRGRPDVYRFVDWLRLPSRIEVPVREEFLPYVEEEAPPAGPAERATTNE